MEKLYKQYNYDNHDDIYLSSECFYKAIGIMCNTSTNTQGGIMNNKI